MKRTILPLQPKFGGIDIRGGLLYLCNGTIYLPLRLRNTDQINLNIISYSPQHEHNYLQHIRK